MTDEFERGALVNDDTLGTDEGDFQWEDGKDTTTQGVVMSDVFKPSGAEVIPVFIGFDHRQPAAYSVLVTSILEFTSKPVQVSPLILETLPIENKGLTPFTFSRFLVPWLCNYKGWAIFMDADFLAQGDIAELWKLRDPSKAVMVAEMPGPEYQFEMASMIMFNCGHPDNTVLTPEHVDKRRSTLIDWTDKVGTVPKEWNHLVGYSKPNADAKLIHFTQGVPAFPETAMCEYAKTWERSAQLTLTVLPWHLLMGNSVHTKVKDGRLVPKLYPDDQPAPTTSYEVPKEVADKLSAER